MPFFHFRHIFLLSRKSPDFLCFRQSFRVNNSVSNCLAHLLLLTPENFMSSWYYHKNDKFCLFSKELKEKSDFLKFGENFRHFQIFVSNFSLSFSRKCDSKIFRFNPTPHCFLFFGHSEFVTVVLAFVNILNSLNRFLIGLLYVRIQGFLVVKLRFWDSCFIYK